MPGAKLLRKIQMGRETTAGTIVDATTVWRGIGVLEDQRETKFPEEEIGYLSKVDRSYVPKLLGALSMDSVEATFEQLPHLLEAGVMTATPVSDTGGSGKIYTYTFPTTALPTIKTYTLEGGDNQQEEEMEYGFVESFSLEGKGGEALMMSAEWKGRQVVPGTFTAALSAPTVETILFSKAKLYIDAVSGTMGTTLISQTLLSMKLDATTGLIPKFTADGQLYFAFVQNVGPEVTAELVFEHNATAVAEKAAYRAQTPRLLRLLIEGAALTTAGTYTYATLKIDLAGKWEKFSTLEDEDGNDTVTGTFRAMYDPTAAKFAEIVVVNQLASLP